MGIIHVGEQMKNRTVLWLFVLFHSAYAATTTVSPGDELSFFDQLVDVFTLKAIEITGNSGEYVIGFIAFCIFVVMFLISLLAVAQVLVLLNLILLKNKK